MTNKLILLILDGWGINPDPKVSAIAAAHTPFMDSLLAKQPHATLVTYGEAVGLPHGQMGNSEVGHLNIGAGRIVWQELLRINNALHDGELEQNATLRAAIQYAKTEQRAIHLVGLVSDGGVHSHINHLKGLCSILHREKVDKTYIHAFTDGRDTDPHKGKAYIADLLAHTAQTTGTIASIIGRYYGMDRDKRWERVKLAYDLLVNGKGKPYTDPLAAIQAAYDANISDEFIPPSLITQANGQAIATIQPHDVVICFNFRTDRCRQITQVLTQQDMPDMGMHTLPLHYVTLTRYDSSFENVQVIFEKDNLNNTLGEVVAQQGLQQIRIAETEKYPHVTFFFSGGREEPFPNEKRIMIPSPKVATYDLQPEMSANAITEAICKELNLQSADFICLNFANTDMVGHTGIFAAAQKAAETVDKCAEQVVNTALKNDYTAILIADHGNADIMINPDGSPNTAHTTNLVPIIWVQNADKPKYALKNGKLADLAPTILHLMNLPIPPEMTGNILITAEPYTN